MNTPKKAPGRKTAKFREYHSPSSGIFFEKNQVLFRKKSAYQEIEVLENDHFGKILILDGLVQTTERDEFFYHELLVHPAMLSHPSPERILIVGGGDGAGLKEVLRYPVKEVYLVEIDPLVVEVSKTFFPWLSPCLEDKRVRLLIADGREFLQKTGERFDVALVDSSDPVGPSLSLHEEDFYRGLKSCVGSEGIGAAQVGSPLYHLESIASKNAFLEKLFKFVCFYLSPVPTYPGGIWCYVFLSQKKGPLSKKRKPPSDLKYYNPQIHRAAFALPAFLDEIFRKR
jgi:spermidine synthase